MQKVAAETNLLAAIFLIKFHDSDTILHVLNMVVPAACRHWAIELFNEGCLVKSGSGSTLHLPLTALLDSILAEMDKALTIIQVTRVQLTAQ